jgi:hypothetical protein
MKQHAWSGDGNCCGETGYDGPICYRCGLPDLPGTPQECKGEIPERVFVVASGTIDKAPETSSKGRFVHFQLDVDINYMMPK